MKLLTPPLVGRNWMALGGKNFDAASLCREVPSEEWTTDGTVTEDIMSEAREGKDAVVDGSSSRSCCSDDLVDLVDKNPRENELTITDRYSDISKSSVYTRHDITHIHI
jgi:hypothetical protein